VTDGDMIFDIGPIAKALADIIMNAKTILWNGPVGVFEFDQFAEGTKVIAEAIAASPAFSIAGGGDTLAAIDKFGIADKVSYISTGGGAFPGVRRRQGTAGCCDSRTRQSLIDPDGGKSLPFRLSCGRCAGS
jgi:hypothetical protein